ncbi:MAG: hypothetical protein N4A36_01455 [Candidatus Gracilibacteria bacterium]|jgi:hypothetical protein|nr:hypothetical protein [Candidatus Gracilibacteria bacterium]
MEFENFDADKDKKQEKPENKKYNAFLEGGLVAWKEAIQRGDFDKTEKKPDPERIDRHAQFSSQIREKTKGYIPYGYNDPISGYLSTF